MNKRLLRVDEVAEMLSVDKRTIYRLLADGELPGVKIRGCLRVQMVCVHEFIGRQVDKWQLENGFVSGVD